jgi:imidazole glycerol-phosphate synthase subunit HisF
MLKKRIIPCLDIKDGRTVKGINFIDIKDAGDPVELGKKYALEGADELVFLDITATVEKRKTLAALVEKIAREINIPFTVGGGINSIEDVSVLIKAGADKISLNSSAVNRPELITEIAKEFGSQCVVVAIDTKYTAPPNLPKGEKLSIQPPTFNGSGMDQWIVYMNGGRTATPLKTLDWAKQVEKLGAGEILLTSMNNDGTKNGFAMDITNSVSNAVNIPVIASGGAGTKNHFKDVFQKTKASGALAASIFHYNEIPIQELKKYLKKELILIR